MEQKGLRLTAKAPKCSTIVKKEFGLKRNATYEEMIRVVEERIAVLKTVADMTPGAVQP